MELFIPFIVSIAALLFAGILAWKALRIPIANERVAEVTGYIRTAAKAFLARQYRTIAVIGLIVAGFLLIFFGPVVAIGFLVGASASALAGYIGMMVAVSVNGPTALRASKGLSHAFQLAFQAGTVTGMLVVGLALLVLTLFWWATQDMEALIALGFGGSLLSIFARIGGGIFTKAADVGADLVGKLETGIPEDDPRNPAVIADNVGDNVGDTAGMAADVFETYLVSAVSAMLLGSLLFPGFLGAIYLPLLIGAVGIVASIASILLVSLARFSSVMQALYLAVAGSIAFSVLLLFPVIGWVVGEGSEISTLRLFGATLVGLIVAGGIFVIIDYYTSTRFGPVRRIAKASESGHGTNVISGLAVGLESTALPVLLISAGILSSFSLAGMYGVALAAMGMLSIAGVMVALDAFGPVADNAGGIAEMAGLPESTRKVTDTLDAAGNTTKAVTKGYAIGSAGIAALVLFVSYKEALGGDITFNLENPYVVVGLLLGGMVSYLFSSFNMAAVGRAAGAVVEEVRRQFREFPGILDGTEKPDYGRTVDIVTVRALREMMYPASLAVISPIMVGFILGPEALGGFLMGGIVTGIFLALSMTSGGGAWDNAKKYIEDGHHGGKGSEAHKAAITGDTVGDPYKDTAGPAINPMIKVINIIALLMVGFLV